MKFKIQNRDFLNPEKTFIICEIAQAHEGSLGIAHSYIDAIADTGADAVKFQMHFADEESTLDEPFRIRFTTQDKTRYDYWKRMEFSKSQWKELRDHSKERNIEFICSPFSEKAVEYLMDLNISVWKISSGEVFNPLLMEAIRETRLPVLISTGMSSIQEIKKHINFFSFKDIPYALFQCTSKYPSQMNEIGTDILDYFRKNFNCPVGLSDHSGTIFPALLTMSRGIDFVEIHSVFDKQMFGPDTSSSLNFEQLKQLLEARDAFWKMESNPVDKDKVADELNKVKMIFSKSLALKQDMKSGEILTLDSLTLKKPGTGIPYKNINEIIGKQLKNDVSAKKLLTIGDFI